MAVACWLNRWTVYTLDAASKRGSVTRCLLLDGLEGDRHRDVVADHKPAGVEHLVIADAVVLAVDGRVGLEGHPLVPPRVLDRPDDGDGQRDLLRDSVQRQCPG